MWRTCLSPEQCSAVGQSTGEGIKVVAVVVVVVPETNVSGHCHQIICFKNFRIYSNLHRVVKSIFIALSEYIYCNQNDRVIKAYRHY
jgi:hypothetical protein